VGSIRGKAIALDEVEAEMRFLASNELRAWRSQLQASGGPEKASHQVLA
jgi:hypothetical protein